jgi:hypothetical protein
MRIGRVGLSFAGVALALVASQGLLAQTATAVPLRNEGPGARTIEPYTATQKTTRVQKLANGTTITHETTVKEARDSSGRTYRESRPELLAGAEGEAASFFFVNVHDPVNRVNINWNSRTKEATVNHFPDPGQMRRIDPAPAQVAMPTQVVRTEMPRPQVEDLGIKTMNGVEAKGTRTTRVIPAGREGNDQPITVVHENWISPELRITVMSINDDPRTGTSTMELTDIERGEPDAGLFQVPEGYTVKDRTPEQPN